MEARYPVSLVVLLCDLGDIIEIVLKFRDTQVGVHFLQGFFRFCRQVLVANEQNLLVPAALMDFG